MASQFSRRNEPGPKTETAFSKLSYQLKRRLDQINKHEGRNFRNISAVACITALVFSISACGSDDEDSGSVATQTPASAEVFSKGNEQVCALAEEIANQESMPTNEQLTRYMTLAPEEIDAAVDIAAQAVIATAGDMRKFYLSLANDNVEQSIVEINDWETDNCGVDHEGGLGAPLEGGATRERESGATVVDVIATDYAFQLSSDEITPGRTSLVLSNNGQEAHFFVLFKLVEGATMEEVMASQDGGEGLVEGAWESGVAAPGGSDEEILTLDLEAGKYGLTCFVSGADGTPHAFMGMNLEFTVA